MELVTSVRGNTCLILNGDNREMLHHFKERFDLIVTSPPYADARKQHYDSIRPDQYAEWFLSFHTSLWDALKPEGSLILNLKDKVVNGQRHRYVWHTIEALCDQGWLSIDDYIWQKTNPMPGRWPNRLRDGWEYCFHLAKTVRPYFNPDGVRVPIGDWAGPRLKNLGENDLSRHTSASGSGFGRDVSKWVGKETVLPSNVLSAAVVGTNKEHPAAFPIDLPSFFIRLLCPENGTVLDPFSGSGTTGVAALQASRNCVLMDNDERYCAAARWHVARVCAAAK